MTIKKILTAFRNRLIAGIFVATPLVLTIWLLSMGYQFIAQFSEPLVEHIILALAEDPVALKADSVALSKEISQMQWLAFLITVAVVFLLGLLATNVFGKRMIEWMEAGILRIPIAATIYTGVKQIMDSVSQFRGNMQFKRVAYVQYPSDECRLIGFVTGQFYDDEREEDMTCIFIPTSPNPMTGFVIVVPNRKVMEANMTMEQASKLILSAGLVGPRFPMPAEEKRRRKPAVPAENGEDPQPEPGIESPEDTPEPVTAGEQPGPPLPHAVRAAQSSTAAQPAAGRSRRVRRDALFRRRARMQQQNSGAEAEPPPDPGAAPQSAPPTDPHHDSEHDSHPDLQEPPLVREQKDPAEHPEEVSRH